MMVGRRWRMRRRILLLSDVFEVEMRMIDNVVFFMKLLQPAHTHTTHVKASNLINAALFLPTPPLSLQRDRSSRFSISSSRFSIFIFHVDTEQRRRRKSSTRSSSQYEQKLKWDELVHKLNRIDISSGAGVKHFFRNFFYLIGLRRRAEVMLECEKCCLYDTSTWGRRLSGRQQGGDEVKLKSMLNAGQDSWVSPDFHLISLPASAVCRRKLNFNRKFI